MLLILVFIPNFSYHYLCVIFSLQTSSARESGPQGVFELRLKKFNNFHASDINGNCCEGLKSNGYCAGRCNTKFRICLKHFQNQVDYNQDCTFGEEITPDLGSNNFTINRAPIKFNINFKWPVSIIKINYISALSKSIYRPKNHCCVIGSRFRRNSTQVVLKFAIIDLSG